MPADQGAATPGATRVQQFSGSGLAILRSHGGEDTSRSSFTHLSATFPLKLISPRTSSRDASLRIARQQADRPAKSVAALYVVGYGGGLVSGDCVSIDFDVGHHCSLLLLTQGSTKVFKMRGNRLSVERDGSAWTSQTFRCIVRRLATLIILPDPVTCFADSRYTQRQQVDLRCPHSSSLVLLDWFTPGRQYLATKSGNAALKETWAFDAYQSRNEIRRSGQVIARDVAALERDSINSIAEKGGPFACFATLFVIGADVVETVERIKADFYQIQQGNKQQSNHPSTGHATTEPLLWSCSPLGELHEGEEHSGERSPGAGPGIVVRVAGESTEEVRSWMREKLVALKQVVGDDLYRQSLGS